MKNFSVGAARLAAGFLLLAYMGCGGDTTEPEPPVATTLSANSSTSITGVAGSVATPPPSVIVKDQNGAPLGGVAVTFAVVSGGGSVSGATVTSDASGIATVGSWTLGAAAGANVVDATSGTLTAVSFTATATAGSAASLARNSGDNQTAPAGSAVPIPPSVIARDANGNPAPGVTVTFAVGSGGGSVTGATAVTNAAGVATVGGWILGSSTGANILNATSGTLTAVAFTATATAGAAASLAKNGGDNQTAAAGSAVPIPPSVIVRDANGNPAPGVTVTFAVGSGGGSITGATAVTNAAGIATVGSWTLGSAAGPNTLNATSGALTAVAFNATATAGAAASLAKNGGDNQTAPAGSPVPIPPSVIVRDANGNPRAGVPVTFSVVSGGGSITGANAVTNAAGIAAVGSWTLGNSAGVNSLTAAVAGLPSVTFTAGATATVCSARSTHTFGTTSSGTLSSGDCVFSDGSFIDFYTTSVPQAGAYFFRESAAFDTYLLLAMPDGTPIGENDDEVETTRNSAVKAILPAGNYLLAPGTLEPGVTGDYTLSSTTAPTEVTNCELVFVVKNIATTQNITTSDCNLADASATPVYADGYFIFINAGASITVNMTSSTLDSFLQLVRIDGQVVAQNDNVDSSTRDARITFTAPQSTYYVVITRSVPTTAVGPYTLTIQ